MLTQSNPEKEDLFLKTQSKFVGANEKFHKTMSSYQYSQGMKLSEPKKTPHPPSIKTYFDKNFDGTREFRKLCYGRNHWLPVSSHWANKLDRDIEEYQLDWVI